jgi:hypothetical protein
MSDLANEPDISRVPLKQFFGITDSYDSGYGEDLDSINSWATEKGLTSEDMLLEIKKIEHKLGSPMPGENRWHRVKHYISLDQKLTKTLKEMAAHERSWGEIL